jgi:hypothetical protein
MDRNLKRKSCTKTPVYSSSKHGRIDLIPDPPTNEHAVTDTHADSTLDALTVANTTDILPPPTINLEQLGNNVDVPTPIVSLTTILEQNKELLDDPTFHKKVVENIAELCRKEKLSKIDAKVKELVDSSIEKAKKLFEEVSDTVPVCPICQETTIFNSKKLNCNHDLCYPCYVKMLQIVGRLSGRLSVKCPLCRKFTIVDIVRPQADSSSDDSDSE